MMRFLCFILASLAAVAAGRAVEVLSVQHVDISINYNHTLLGSGVNPWLLTVRDEDERTEYAGVRALFQSDEERVVLVALGDTMIEVPDDDRFFFLGAEGAPVWIMPQTQEPGVLYAGIAAENKTTQVGWVGEGVPANLLVRGVATGSLFQSNRVTLRLEQFSGPGNFFLYTTDSFGDPTIYMRTDNGLSSADARQISAASHSHYNWAFTAPGEYFLGFRASGVLSVGSQSVSSDLTTFHFRVVPEPGSAALVLIGVMFLFRRHHTAKPKTNQNRPT